MNGRLQRLSLLIRALLATAAGWWLWPLCGPGLAIPAAVLVLCARSISVLLLFATLPFIQRHETLARPRWHELLHAWPREGLLLARVFDWQQPFAEHREPDHLVSTPGQCGVLLLHGYSCNRGLWNPWMRRLRERGTPFIALSLEPAFGSIDSYADSIEAAIQQLEQATGQPPLVVAHSMGGLAARAWWRQFGRSGRVQRIVTLGSPHAGTVMATFGPSRNARQMRRHSRWLAELAATEQGQGSMFRCYFSNCDQIVCPAGTAVLPGAETIHLPAQGHLSLVFHQQVFKDVLQLLDKKKP